MRQRPEGLRGLLRTAAPAVALCLAVAWLPGACVSTPDGPRLHPLARVTGQAACAVAEGVCAATLRPCPALADLCAAADSALRLATARDGQLWYCVAYTPDALENPQDAMACGRSGGEGSDGGGEELRCVCWTDPEEAAQAAAEPVD